MLGQGGQTLMHLYHIVLDDSVIAVTTEMPPSALRVCGQMVAKRAMVTNALQVPD